MLDDSILRDLTAQGIVRLARSLAYASENLVPNPAMDIAEWIEGVKQEDGTLAGAHVIIPSSVSTRSGPMVLTPIQRIICSILQRVGVKRFAFLKTPRMGSTLFMAALLLYFAVHEGMDVLYYERTDDAAQDFNDKKLFPVMQESLSVRNLMRPDGKGGVQDKWTDRYLRNGAGIQLRSAFGKTSARAIRARFIAVDEASSGEYLPTAGGEGNKIDAIWRRAQEFADAIMYIGGTPTHEGACIVTQEFMKGDRCVVEMPAPCCGHWQEFVPDVQRVASRDDRRGGGIRYIVDDSGRLKDVWYECANPDCRKHIEETSKVPMMDQGRDRAMAEPIDPDFASLVAWLAYSTDPQATWSDIAKAHFETLQDPAKLQSFENLTMARAFRYEPPRTIPIGELEKRAIDYGASCPDWVTDVYYGIDNQQGGNGLLPRVEMVFYGAGPNKRRAIIKRVVISHYDVVDQETGEVESVPCEPFTGPSMRAVWDEIDNPIITADGRVLKPARGGVDVGWRMQEALAFAHHPESKLRKMIPVRGRKEVGMRGTVLPSTISTHFKSKLPFFMVGTQTAKDYLMASFANPSGVAHSWEFPKDIALLGEDFYQQLLAEGLHETRPGSKVYLWEKIKPTESNEVIDCTVYAYCAEEYDCKRNRATRQRLAVTIMPTAAVQENVGLDSITPTHQPVAKDSVMADADLAAGGDDVAAPVLERTVSINARTVLRKQPAAQQLPAKAVTKRKTRQSSLLSGW